MLHLQKIIPEAIILPTSGKAWSACSRNIPGPEGRVPRCPHSPAVKTVKCNKLIKNPERLLGALKSDMKIEGQAKQIRETIILYSQPQLFLQKGLLGFLPGTSGTKF